ncbi:MAG: 1,4-dihydroxy-2-naphthoate polyprenyltransferase [Pseudomonadota bacterium]|nr:1,4-dihydroxy-2-naphthoate polyprenyltransferase [Pseudomonadota bacterium]
MNPWVAAVRPQTLSIAIVPVAVGSTLAWLDVGSLDWFILMATLCAALLIQAGTNLHNDAADFERGADRVDNRRGPPRATAAGWLTVGQVRRAAWGCFALAAIFGIWLIFVGGWPILLLGTASILAGLSYTGGPRPIGYLGLGELFVWLFFGVAAVVGTYYLQTGSVGSAAVLLGALTGMPAAAVLVVNNTRDIEGDREAGKRTLAVRFGLRFSRMEYAMLVLTPFPLVWIAYSGTGRAWLALTWIAVPWAVVLVRAFSSASSGSAYNGILVSTAKLNALYGGLLCAAMVVNGVGVST